MREWSKNKNISFFIILYTKISLIQKLTDPKSNYNMLLLIHYCMSQKQTSKDIIFIFNVHGIIEWKRHYC